LRSLLYKTNHLTATFCQGLINLEQLSRSQFSLAHSAKVKIDTPR